jgi:riboflavin biosynthesis pyrimidine reductase
MGEPPGTELLVAPSDQPEPGWVLDRLAERGIRSLLLEGGPTTNAAFLAADCIDELYWTIGARLLGTDALPMIAPIPGESPWAEHPREGQLVSLHRSGDELFVRYRFARIGP